MRPDFLNEARIVFRPFFPFRAEGEGGGGYVIFSWVCKGLQGAKSLPIGQRGERECRQNVRKMSKNVQTLSGRAENTIFGHFLTIFAYLVDAFVGDPVQRSPVTSMC